MCRGLSPGARAAAAIADRAGRGPSELTAAAECVLSGSTSFEKEPRTPTIRGKAGGRDRDRAAGRRPDDCLILANFAMLVGLTVSTPERARTEIAAELISCREGMCSDDVQPSGLGRTLASDVEPFRALEGDFLSRFASVKGALDPSARLRRRVEAGRGGPPGVIRSSPSTMQEVSLFRRSWQDSVVHFPCVLRSSRATFRSCRGHARRMRGTGAAAALAFRYEAAGGHHVARLRARFSIVLFR